LPHKSPTKLGFRVAKRQKNLRFFAGQKYQNISGFLDKIYGVIILKSIRSKGQRRMLSGWFLFWCSKVSESSVICGKREVSTVTMSDYPSSSMELRVFGNVGDFVFTYPLNYFKWIQGYLLDNEYTFKNVIGNNGLRVAFLHGLEKNIFSLANNSQIYERGWITNHYYQFCNLQTSTGKVNVLHCQIKFGAVSYIKSHNTWSPYMYMMPVYPLMDNAATRNRFFMHYWITIRQLFTHPFSIVFWRFEKLLLHGCYRIQN